MKRRFCLGLPSGAKGLSRCLRASFFPVFVSVFLSACSSSHERIDIIEVKCGRCHAPDIVYEKKRSRYEWDILLNGMKVRGLEMTGDEERQVKDALYNKLGNGK